MTPLSNSSSLIPPLWYEIEIGHFHFLRGVGWVWKIFSWNFSIFNLQNSKCVPKLIKMHPIFLAPKLNDHLRHWRENRRGYQVKGVGGSKFLSQIFFILLRWKLGVILRTKWAQPPLNSKRLNFYDRSKLATTRKKSPENDQKRPKTVKKGHFFKISKRYFFSALSPIP